MKKKILFGICGLGNGHTMRQSSLVEYFSKTCDVIVLGHDNSFDYFSIKYANSPSVKVVKVAIPFYIGNKDGIDFQASLESPLNHNDVFKINCEALSKISKEFQKPDLVISDYEPVAAQYAYLHTSPLVTIDQQSKYLCGDFPHEIAGFTFSDEIMRLHMFFPKAAARIACSFFNVPLKDNTDNVMIFPPTLKDSVVNLKRQPVQNQFLVYISTAREYVESPEQIIKALSLQKNAVFNLFVGKGEMNSFNKFTAPNVRMYNHGDPLFMEFMAITSGIISTAGHSLLSEAMYLGIPVYGVPVSPYEQHMNAYIIDKNKFGVSASGLLDDKLKYFIENIALFESNIANDRSVLLRGVGQTKIIEFLEDNLLAK